MNVIYPNRRAFLDMLAHSEIGAPLLAASNNGYNVIVGSTASKPNLFEDYSDHPRKLIQLRPGLASTAAGRYQLLARYYDAYKASLSLLDFSPESQDAIALQQIRERGALPLIDGGSFDLAVGRCSNIWASLPGAGYKQHENDIEALRIAFQNAGGVIT